MSKKRISRRTRTLLLTSVALLAVVGLVVALVFLLPEKPKDDPDEAPDTDAIVLMDKSEGDIDIAKAEVNVAGNAALQSACGICEKDTVDQHRRRSVFRQDRIIYS